MGLFAIGMAENLTKISRFDNDPSVSTSGSSACVRLDCSVLVGAQAVETYSGLRYMSYPQRPVMPLANSRIPKITKMKMLITRLFFSSHWSTAPRTALER
jgi:hypothetical protein